MLRKIPATLVPSIKELRRKLGYGDSNDQRCQTFYDDTRAFRKKYTTSNGIKGKDLYQWKDETHYAGLEAMSKAYLDENGHLFWPDEDGEQLKELMIQLFFRLNLQQYRNEKYRGKESKKRRQDGANDQRPVKKSRVDRPESPERQTAEARGPAAPSVHVRRTVDASSSPCPAGDVITVQPVAPPPPPPVPRVIFGYLVILSRTPVFDLVNWIPKGRVTDMTLLEIKKEIPLNLATAKGLLFTLKGPDFRCRFDIPDGDEDQLVLMKEEFEDAIRQHSTKTTGSKELHCSIYIEALREAPRDVEQEVETRRYMGKLDW